MFRFIATRTLLPLRSALRPTMEESAVRMRQFSTKTIEPPPPPEENPNRVSEPTCTVVYDGSCPVCKSTVKNLNLDGAKLINARNSNDPTVKALEEAGHNLDDSMVVITKDNKVLTGAEAVQELGKQQGEGILGSALRSVGPGTYRLFKMVRDKLVPESIAEQRAREAEQTESIVKKK